MYDTNNTSLQYSVQKVNLTMKRNLRKDCTFTTLLLPRIKRPKFWWQFLRNIELSVPTCRSLKSLNALPSANHDTRNYLKTYKTFQIFVHPSQKYTLLFIKIFCIFIYQNNQWLLSQIQGKHILILTESLLWCAHYTLC